jgi:hypothetical protein
VADHFDRSADRHQQFTRLVALIVIKGLAVGFIVVDAVGDFSINDLPV